MHDGDLMMTHRARVTAIAAVWPAPVSAFVPPVPAASRQSIPDYLTRYYAWAYVHDWAVRLFERQWLVNLILWGNYARLSAAALDRLGDVLPGATLQVACVYGDLTARLARRIAAEGRLDVVDVLPVQLDNLRAKLPAGARTRLLAMNSAALDLPDSAYDRALIFFLLHEQPEAVRAQTMHEVARVVKPGGTIVIVDYARPRWWHPLRYLFRPVLARLEPFALALWQRDIADWLPSSCTVASRQSLFGGLYQCVVAVRRDGE